MTAIPQATAIDGYRWLKNDIIRGVYQPDEKLRMSLLTSRYELGVGPLREALSQLVAERLVTVVNQKGYRVAPMSEQELLDIFDARANMEAMLVRLAIERGGDEWEAELLARAHLLNKLESCDASERLLDEWDQRHQAFHTAIVAGCGSQYLLQMRERLFDLAARYRFIWLRTTVLSVEMLEDKHVQHQTLLDAILARRLAGEPLSEHEVAQFKTAVLVFLGAEYARRGWVQQYHIGALRNNNLRQFKLLGPDVGFDSINDRPMAEELSKLLSKQNEENLLPKTILYCLNPRDNEVLGTMIGNFQGEGMPGKMQFGSGWWFNDQKDGMERQMTQLAQLGLLSRFVGMLTDSRSFLSYTRHEYFRRILCQMIGRWVEAGEAPADINLLGEMVKNICFNNARDYFAIELN